MFTALIRYLAAECDGGFDYHSCTPGWHWNDHLGRCSIC